MSAFEVCSQAERKGDFHGKYVWPCSLLQFPLRSLGK